MNNHIHIISLFMLYIMVNHMVESDSSTLEYHNENVCKDDEAKTFTHTTIHDVYGFDCEKLKKITDPTWLDSICNGNGIPNGNEVCPVTCNVCTCATCYDKKDVEGVIRYKYEGTGRLISCKALEKPDPLNRDENTDNEWNLDWRCSKIPTIRKSCPESCKVCRHCASPSPSTKPSSNPTSKPTPVPSSAPSSHPSITSSSSPSVNPTSKPTLLPSVSPSTNPTSNPTSTLTMIACATCWDKKDEEGAIRYTYNGNPSLIHCKNLEKPFQAFNDWNVDWKCSNIPEIRKSCPESCKICAHCAIPTLKPSSIPTSTPTVDPSSAPSNYPSITSSSLPSVNPTSKPTLLPSVSPSTKPTTSPHSFPSSHPTTKPSSNPTSKATTVPSMNPSTEPTATPTLAPTADIATVTECFNKYAKGLNTKKLNFADTLLFVNCYNAHSLMPSSSPSILPTAVPSKPPSSKPSVMPSSTPTIYPSHAPSELPTMHPTSGPSSNPSVISSTVPSTNPSHSSDPSAAPTNCEFKKDSVAPFSYQYQNHPLTTITCEDLSIASPFEISGQSKTLDNWYVDYRCYEVLEVLFSCPETCRLCVPSSTPSSTPSASPTSAPTPLPSSKPSSTPSASFTPSSTPSALPTSAPTPIPSIVPTNEPTPLPTKSPTELTLKDYGFSAHEDHSPLQLCEGDCDKDDHCEVGLICFQRDRFLPVPGCKGNGKSDYDYCVAQSSIPSFSPSVKANLDPTNIQSTVPSMSPTLAPFETPSSILPDLKDYGKSAHVYWSPLFLCEGDCDYDSHCDAGLICFQRDGLSPVPGCNGNGQISYDYCVSKQTVVPSVTTTHAPSATPTVVPSVTTTHVPSATISQSPTTATAPTACIDRKDSTGKFSWVNSHEIRVELTCEDLHKPHYKHSHQHWHIDWRCEKSKKIREKYCPERCKICVNVLSTMAIYDVTETHLITNGPHAV